MDRILTIGVYGWTAERWLRTLDEAGCDLLVDIRARRGVRGHEYAFANRVRLEAMLAGAGIPYLYLPQVAPGESVRDAQAAADRASHIRRRDRPSLSEVFIQRYRREVEDRVDWRAVAGQIEASVPALLCVERVPEACHRSMAAGRLAAVTGARVQHLVP